MSNERPQNGIFFVLGAILLLLAGYGIRKLIIHPPAPVAIPAPDADPDLESPSVTINFYMDDSGSMLHFITTPAAADGDSPENYFKEFLEKVGGTLSYPPGEVGWKGKAHFLRFGAGSPGISPIPGDDPHQMSERPQEFFHASETSIEKAIRDEQVNKGEEGNHEVKVIVTDLYESGGRFDKPAKALVEKYLASASDPDEKHAKNAVDILAVRNPQDGEVEDMPGAGRATLHKAANTMPFYVIVAGPTADVRHVMKALLDNTSLAAAKKNHKAAEFLFTRTPLPRSTDALNLGGDGRFVETDEYKALNIPLIHLKSGLMEMSWPDAVKLPDGVVDLYGDKDNSDKKEHQQLLATVQIPGATPSDKPVPYPDGSRAIDECSHPDLLCKRIDRNKLPVAGGTYILKFDRVVKEPTAALDLGSDDLKEWNIEEAEAEVIGRTPQKNNPHFENMKGLTPGLSTFFNPLKGAMFSSPVPITTYYVYLQAE